MKHKLCLNNRDTKLKITLRQTYIIEKHNIENILRLKV